MVDTVLAIRSGLFRLILTFLHIVYSGLQYFDIAWALFKRKFESHAKLQEFSDSQLYVSRIVTKLKKCPSHFAVVVGSERIQFEDFSNLILWCSSAGISYVSFYDYTGYLKDNHDLYYKYLINSEKLDPSYVTFNVRPSCGIKNGFKKNGVTKKIHVNILSIEDGKALFAKVVENVCKKAVRNEIQIDDVTEEYIDEEMHQVMGLTDPELALICGSVCSTYGFLPWHIKLTEFLQVPSIENMSVSEFTSILIRYSRCQQRFGR